MTDAKRPWDQLAGVDPRALRDAAELGGLVGRMLRPLLREAPTAADVASGAHAAVQLGRRVVASGAGARTANALAGVLTLQRAPLTTLAAPPAPRAPAAAAPIEVQACEVLDADGQVIARRR